MTKERRRFLVALTASVALLAPLAWWWQASLLPDTYSVMEMGHADYGGGPVPAAGGHSGAGDHGALSVADLVADPDRPADVRVTLTARQETFRLVSGEQVDGYTVNGTSPGPTIEALQGQLVEAVVRNESVAAGVAIHWHGVDVPNAMDGVAGITQDATPVGGRHVYRFVAEQVGTYWYHSHQVSHEQVKRGLFGALVVRPAEDGEPMREELALLHVYQGTATVNGMSGEQRVPAEPGERVRVRVINTDNGAVNVWTSGGGYKLIAVDGYDVNAPAPVDRRFVEVTAGGRADLEVTAPVRVEFGATALVVGSDVRPSGQPGRALDLLDYGRPTGLAFDPDRPDRRFEYSIGRRPGFIDGRPGVWWSVNGNLFPDVPMFVVEEGDVVAMTIENHSGEAHPMHLHGHHAVVLSRNGKRATGSPWWVDSLEVSNGETYEIAFLADNPGVWADHCHNLPHAAEGLLAHLMYAGVDTPYRIGGGPAGNHPE